MVASWSTVDTDTADTGRSYLRAVAPLCQEGHGEGVAEHAEDLHTLLPEPGLLPDGLAQAPVLPAVAVAGGDGVLLRDTAGISRLLLKAALLPLPLLLLPRVPRLHHQAGRGPSPAHISSVLV